MATSIGVKLKMDGEAEFRKNLNNIVSSTKNLDKQLDILEKSFKDEAKSMEQNQKQTELLERKKEALQKQVEEMNQALEYAKEHYSENSAEVTSWEAALAQAESQLEETNQQLQECVDYQEEATSALDETTSALDELTSTIADQESQLDDLRDAYVDAVLEFGEGSDQANELAGEISSLSGELQTNRARLSEAQDSLEQVEGAANTAAGEIGEMRDAASEAGETAVESLVGQFAPAFGQIASAIEEAGVAGAIGAILAVAIEVGEQAVTMATEWQEAMNEMALATVMTGSELADLQNIAYEAWLEVNDANVSLEDMERIGGTLVTRLGLTGDSLKEATTLFGKYSGMVGEDGVNAVNDLVSIMKLWGLESEDEATNIETLNSLMDKFVYAQGQGQLSVQDVTSAMLDQAGSWQSVGYSIDEALALMAAYTDAGGSASDITSAVDKTVRSLAGNTDDMNASWNEALEMITNANDRFSVLDETIGDTGVTIGTAFGKSAAGRMVDVFKDGKVNADAYSEGLANATGKSEELYDATRTVGDEVEQAKKEFIDWNLNGNLSANIADLIADAFKGTGDEADDMGDSVKDATIDVKNFGEEGFIAGDRVKQAFEDAAEGLGGAEESMTQSYNDLLYTFSNPIPMHISAPSVGYYQTGTGGSTRYTPYYGGRYTFARGYDQAMILTAPTIFGASGNDLLVGGDRQGAEVVVGESHLLGMMDRVMSHAIINTFDGGIGTLVGLLDAYLPEIANLDIYLDSGALVGGTVKKMNNALGSLSVSTKRGMA